MPYAIRPATPADYDQACALFDNLDRLHEDARPDRFFAPDGPRRLPDEFLGLLQRADAAIFVAEADGLLAGLVQCEAKDYPARRDAYARRAVYVEFLVVAPAHRGRGLGRALLERVHAWASERGIRQVELHVWEFNAEALALYERLGYRTATRVMELTLPDW